MYKRQLLELGIPADIRGFEMLNAAISMYKPGQSIIGLYKDIGKLYGATREQVERNMRHAVGKTYEDITVGQFVAKYQILWGEDDAR